MAEKGEKRTAWNKDAGVISFVIFIFFFQRGKSTYFQMDAKNSSVKTVAGTANNPE